MAGGSGDCGACPDELRQHKVLESRSRAQGSRHGAGQVSRGCIAHCPLGPLCGRQTHSGLRDEETGFGETGKKQITIVINNPAIPSPLLSSPVLSSPLLFSSLLSSPVLSSPLLSSPLLSSPPQPFSIPPHLFSFLSLSPLPSSGYFSCRGNSFLTEEPVLAQIQVQFLAACEPRSGSALHAMLSCTLNCSSGHGTA